MRLSVITDEISQEFEHALDVMAEYGVTGAELRGLWGTNIADLDAGQIARAQRALAERGMVASALATPMFKCDLVEAAPTIEGPMHLASARGRSDQLELLRRIRFVLPDCVIAVYTGVMNRAWSLACHLAGANCMLSKQSEQRDLSTGLRRALLSGCYTDPRFAA